MNFENMSSVRRTDCSLHHLGYPSFSYLFEKAINIMCVCAQSCPALCDPIDCSLPSSSVHGILQARILEWVAISFSKGSSQPRD